MERTIFFHEDDYGQIELLPASAWAYCQQEMGMVEDFAQAHAVPGGYRDIYLRQPGPSFLPLAVPFEHLAAAVTPIWPAFDRVETGYGSYREVAQQTRAFGENTTLALFCSVMGQKLVEDVWLTLLIQDEHQLAAVQQVLAAVSTLAPLLLADWNGLTAMLLGDGQPVEGYLKQMLGQWQTWEASR